MGEVQEIPVPGRGRGTAVAALLLWGMALALLMSDAGLVAQLPPWSAAAVMAMGPLVAMFAAWSLVTRRVVIAGPDGVRVTSLPFGLDLAFVPRRVLMVVSIEERDDDDDRVEDSHGLLMTARAVHWAVVAVTRDRGDVTLATRFRDAESARRVAERIRQATGC